MKKINEEVIAKITSTYLDGHSIDDVADLLSISESTVSKYLKKQGVKTRSQIKYSINEGFFDNIKSEKQAYWLGFLMADGYVAQKRQKKKNKNGLSLHSRLVVRLKIDDYHHLEKMAKDMGSNHPVKIINVTDINGLPSKQASIEIYNKRIVESLFKIGCIQNKSKVIEYPDIPKPLDRHFIRGFFDGDGSIYFSQNRKHAKFCSSSYKFLNILKEVLNENNIKTGAITDGKSVYILGVSASCRDYFLKWMYDDSVTYLDRKKEMS